MKVPFACKIYHGFETACKVFLLIYNGNEEQGFLELLLREPKMPDFCDDLDEQLEMFMDSRQTRIELCNSVKECKEKNVNHLGLTRKLKKLSVRKDKD